MNETVGQLLSQGLIMTAIGMGLVFLALALLWGLIKLLSVLFADRTEQGASPLMVPIHASVTVTPRDDMAAADAIQAQEALTTERARVAAIVAGAMLSNALPLLFEVPTGPAFEHGRTAPSWVISNRARTLRAWQPPRVSEGQDSAQ